MVAIDMMGASGHGNQQVAYSAHLAGTAFAFVYYQQRWNIAGMTTASLPWLQRPFCPKTRLRVHRPEKDSEPPPSDLAQEVDRIKISLEGESGLTAKERRT